MAEIRKNVTFADKPQTICGRTVQILFLICFSAAFVAFTACSIPPRSGYDRSIGGYKSVPSTQSSGNTSSEANTAPVQTTQVTKTQTQADPKAVRQTSAGNVKAAATQKSLPVHERPKTSFENYARQWLGAKYVYGAAEKTRTDCSGYVMQVYKGYWGISLNHNAANMYDDNRGKSVSRGSLKEGDLIFFGSFWKIDHVGIYLSGDRFIHASTSKGVMISPMNDKYWSPKYKGARRFK